MKLGELKAGSWQVGSRPVLPPSGAGWDGHSSMTPVVFRNAQMGVEGFGAFGMLYIGIGLKSSAWGVGYAFSDDLLSWRRDERNPVILQDEGSGFQLDAPCLLREDGSYRLICEERKVRGGPADTMRRLLGPRSRRLLREVRSSLGLSRPTVVNHAEGRYFVSFASQDIFEWDLGAKKVVFEGGATGAFDEKGVFSPQVYSFDGKELLFYGGTDGKRACTGLAASSGPGAPWARLHEGPVLSPGGKGAWDEVNALIVSVLRLEDSYCAFYEGEDAKGRYGVGIAWSEDLLNWTKWGENPIVAPGQHAYCERMVCGPRVFREGDELFLFFNAHGADMRGACGVAAFRRGR